MADTPDANSPEHERSPAWTTDPYVGKPYGFERRLPTSPSNGRDPLSGMPWWVKAVFILGAPTCIALFLVWTVTGTLAQNVATNGDRLSTLQTTTERHDDRVRAQFDDLKRASETQTRILRSICQSVAKNDLQREKCTE